MKIIIQQNQLAVSYFQFLKEAGYNYIENRHTGQGSFARPLGNNHYPRFHIYVDEFDDGRISIKLHLDQKQASYEGTTAHSGEYDDEGPVLAEGERLKTLVGRSTSSNTKPTTKSNNPWDALKK